MADLVVFILSALAPMARSYDVTLAWDPNDKPGLAGYVVHVKEGGADTVCHQMDTVALDEIEPNALRYAVSELQYDVNYCFAVTAYNTGSTESDFSNTVCVLNGWVDSSQDIATDPAKGRPERRVLHRGRRRRSPFTLNQTSTPSSSVRESSADPERRFCLRPPAACRRKVPPVPGSTGE